MSCGGVRFVGARLAVQASASARLAARSVSRYLAGDELRVTELINVRMLNLSEKEKDVLFRDFQEMPRAQAERRDT